MDFTGINFMGAAVGILALVCTLVLLFGQRGARKILGWGVATVAGGLGCNNPLCLGRISQFFLTPKWASDPIVKPAPAATQPTPSQAPCSGLGCIGHGIIYGDLNIL
jgi:hypothetical protein